ncbi:MAG TPA: Ppx/GppA family phosphatase, partial [Polyangiaceae bacterium]|nr:Ppx/GppA family phosphatase [Polyangiaceae bacterium]
MNVAAIDIGTNSIRLLITDAQGKQLAREMNITRLGQGVDKTGRLADDAVTRSLAVLGAYGAQMK